jgi:hypothetical protein
MRGFVHSIGNLKVIIDFFNPKLQRFEPFQAIMVNGEFKCLGSTQHLKNKFSKGFFLTIKIGSENRAEDLNERIVAVKQFVSQNFSGAVLK